MINQPSCIQVKHFCYNFNYFEYVPLFRGKIKEGSFNTMCINAYLKTLFILMSLLYIVRFSLEGMLTEFNSLKTNVQRLKSQLQNVDQEVKDQFSSFLEVDFSLNLFLCSFYYRLSYFMGHSKY